MTEPWRLTATELLPLLAAREVSAREALASVLARIDLVNPALTAIVRRMDEEAFAAADAVDAARAAGEPLGPLAGVPVTVKVNVDLAGHPTTNGLRTQAGLIAAEDSPVTANLKAAGAVIAGQTNAPAHSLRWFTRNRVHGWTRNPRNHALTPGGSSGGAGACVAAGMGPIAHGTDIAGSIRYPAYACGVHGLRPSLGRVPSFNPSGGDRLIGGQLMAVSGPLARSIPDLRLALAAMAAPDPRDPWSLAMPLSGRPAPRRVALIEAPDGMEVAPAVRAALRAAAARLAAAGYAVETPAAPPPLREAMVLQLRLWMAEFRHDGEAAARAESDPDALLVFEGMRRHSPEIGLGEMMDTLKSRARLARAWRGFLRETPLVLMPVSGEAPFADQRDVASPADFDAVLEAQLPMIATPFMGLPGLTVCTGTGAAPMGVQLVADRFREDLLLEAGEILAPAPVDIALA